MIGNCLVVALATKLCAPRSVKIFRKGRFSYRRRSYPHWYWRDERAGEFYHFVSHSEDVSMIGVLCYVGSVRVYDFARHK